LPLVAGKGRKLSIRRPLAAPNSSRRLIGKVFHQPERTANDLLAKPAFKDLRPTSIPFLAPNLKLRY
jgi:hypothetical protein